MSRMGDLANTFDYGVFDVPLEQSTGVGWANRMGEILTTRSPDNPAVAYKTPYFDITEGDIGRATEAALGGMTVTPKGLKAYHSSPHDFEKFDLAKIGTGEGAQAYGHGLYFAESPAVSGRGGQYWQQFANRFPEPERRAADRLKTEGFNRDAAIAANEKDVADWRREIELMAEKKDKGYYRERGWAWQDDLKNAERMLALRTAEREALLREGPVGPRTYEVNINADPAHMLDWDKALQQQPETLKRVTPLLEDYKLAPSNYLGESLHKEIRDFHQSHGMSKTAAAEAAAIDLRSSGIPGIKYLDEGSRRPAISTGYNNIDIELGLHGGNWEAFKQAKIGKSKALDDAIRDIDAKGGPKFGPQTSNYVVFDPGIIDIMKKYGIAGAAPAGMGAIAAQDTYQPRGGL